MTAGFDDTRPGVKTEAIGLLLGFIGVLIFGATLPATKIALGGYSPWFITFGRATIATIAAATTLLVTRRPFPKAHVESLLLIGLAITVGFPGLMALAMQTVPAAHGGVVLGILPLATAMFAALIGHERPSAAFWAWGTAGTALVVWFAIHDSGMRLALGDIYLFLACLCAALGYVISGRLSRVMPGWEVISWTLVLSSPIAIIGTAATFEPAFLSATPGETIALLYTGLFSMFLGFFAWNIGLAMGGIARVSQVQLLQTFVTIAVSALVAGETIDAETLAVATAVVAIVGLGRRARVHTPTVVSPQR
jgi:drug/metabolite transporter (DMT)-like permease